MPDIFDSTQLESEETAVNPSKEEVLHAVKEKRAHSHEKKHKKKAVEEYSEVMSQMSAETSPWASFAAKPRWTAFSTQAPDEQILLLLRKHPLTQVGWVVIAIIIALIPIVFAGIPFLGFLPPTYHFAVVLGWYMLLAGFIIESFLTWYFNVYIITDERIIDVDFLSLIYQNISAAKIDNIEDVTATKGGALRSVFDFGTVHIQTAAEKTQFEFEDVPHPSQVTKLLNELILEEEREKNEGRVN
jgi:hypothetical protein